MLKPRFIEIFLCVTFLVFFSLLIKQLLGVSCSVNRGCQHSFGVLCPSELLVTVHTNETDVKSVEEVLSEKLRVLEVLLGSDQERMFVRGVVGGFRHKFKRRAVAPVDALTQGSEWD